MAHPVSQYMGVTPPSLSRVRKVVDSIFEQLQNNYNALFKLIVCCDMKVRQLIIIIIKIMKGKFQ